MGKLFYVIGKSSSGKDTIFQRLLKEESLKLRPLVLYTTRPMRAGEEPGVQYHFTDEAGLKALQEQGKVIELRAYDTVYGVWKYFTADTEATDLESGDYLGIGVLESYKALRDYYGSERVVPLYIEVEDGERLQRALNRERAQEKPRYAEMCRRFLADSEDFSEEHIREAGIEKRFYNRDLDACMEEIMACMKNTVF
ncbi:guanylate kinase [Anaerosacchariphilus sp. NSJ-68]|uniref:Guanylate kinase n=2 Tax=Lachnospiraceae TaxID=186803 RepID=A0A923RMW4_9FIRM|nr:MULTISPECIES: guanylate kinase [Lachnospiraceae]MBC5660728.1 guanylate kinase [Anaerosacchariphilus hominis]MBC5697949.1 guanylate kinase [Roseburia difficilis]